MAGRKRESSAAMAPAPNKKPKRQPTSPEAPPPSLDASSEPRAMTTVETEESSSASSQVFGIKELHEQIFLDLDVFDLLRLKRVNKEWEQFINATPSLRRKLFLTQTTTSTPIDVANSQPMKGLADSWKANPFLPHRQPLLVNQQIDTIIDLKQFSLPSLAPGLVFKPYFVTRATFIRRDGQGYESNLYRVLNIEVHGRDSPSTAAAPALPAIYEKMYLSHEAVASILLEIEAPQITEKGMAHGNFYGKMPANVTLGDALRFVCAMLDGGSEIGETLFGILRLSHREAMRD